MIPDLVGSSEPESGRLPRIAGGKGRRTEDERFRSSKGAREMSTRSDGGRDLHTSTPRSRRPKPRQEEQAPMECAGSAEVVDVGQGVVIVKRLLEYAGGWTAGLKTTSVIWGIAKNVPATPRLSLHLWSTTSDIMQHAKTKTK